MNRLTRITHSLSARLVLVFIVASISYWYALGFALQTVQDSDYLRRIAGAHISLHAEYVLEDIGTPPSVLRAEDITSRIPVDIRLNGPSITWTSDPLFPEVVDIPFGPLSILELSDASLTDVEDWVKQLEKVEFARFQEHVYVKLTQGDYQVVFVSPKIADQPAPAYDTRLIFGVLGSLLLPVCFVGVNFLINPIQSMLNGAARIGGGDLDFRIKKRRKDDLGDLADGINAMADDLQEMLEAKRQLMLAISHELRSPLTRTKLALEFLDNDATKQSLLEDVEEMERLITDILESEALNTRHASLRRETGNLISLTQSVIDLDFAQRAAGRIVLIANDLDFDGDYDSTRIRLLVRNLLDNALRHTPANANPVEISFDRIDGLVYVRVRDHGHGIAADDLLRITEPFYRADPARSRHTGGFGLGLHLCRRIVEAHGGELIIESDLGKGTVVTATINPKP
ncbi:MAG: HAMP domain-containing sensor histidine kinase [Gammaproteobacteria bacterium]|nr:HAMP domain-containing sensor histidine kinase [Gammaproteobacteria bacterium]